jgi:hypothetical protein
MFQINVIYIYNIYIICYIQEVPNLWTSYTSLFIIQLWSSALWHHKDTSTLKMEVIHSSEMLVTTYNITQHHNPEELK